jgi:hypothetical protein
MDRGERRTARLFSPGAFIFGILGDMSGRFVSWTTRSIRIEWGLFLLLILAAGLIATGAPLSAGFVAGSVLVLLLVWHAPYLGFYLSLATAPLLGILVSLSTGQFQFGERAFGGSIDVLIGEVIAAAVLAVWALRLLLIWREKDKGWKPWLPLGLSFAALVGAHMLSALARYAPDPILVIKYSLRPVFFAYLFSVVLPVNFIRSRARLFTSLAILSGVGLFFALDGFRSLFAWDEGFSFLYRARPLPILGFSPIGENHNVLAELLIFTAPLTLALGLLSYSPHVKKYTYWASGLMSLIALLTFARSAWIAVAVEVVLLSLTIWRPFIKRHLSSVVLGAVAFLPLLGYMVFFSLTPGVKSSTGARTMLTEIAFFLFRESPLIGSGAGSFVDRVSRTQAYVMEYGTPLDSHGILQKLAAETGLLGLLAFAVVVCALALLLFSFLRQLRKGTSEHTALVFLSVAVAGSFVYQLFNTTYWSPKLWLPVGIALAAGRVLAERQAARDPDFLTSPYG